MRRLIFDLLVVDSDEFILQALRLGVFSGSLLVDVGANYFEQIVLEGKDGARGRGIDGLDQLFQSPVLLSVVAAQC